MGWGGGKQDVHLQGKWVQQRAPPSTPHTSQSFHGNAGCTHPHPELPDEGEKAASSRICRAGCCWLFTETARRATS